MTWSIVADSSCDLPESAFDSPCAQFVSAPLRILVGAQEFVDNDDLKVPDLLMAMREEKSASSSACPSPEAFAQAFRQSDCSICFTISSALSGTYNAAMMAREMVLEENPEKKICVIDTKCTAGSLVILIQKAQALLEENPDIDPEDLFAQLRVLNASSRIVFTLECYDNLVKNGRMRPLVGNLLKSLGIRIVAIANSLGEIEVVGKARGEAKAYQTLVRQMAAMKDCTGAKVVISHCQNPVGAARLQALILETLPVDDVAVYSCRGLTSYYAMENGLIIGF